MELGPIQKAWIKSLRKYPERQVKGVLGSIEKGVCKFCCLGQGLIEVRIINGESFEEIIKPEKVIIRDNDDIGLYSTANLIVSYVDLGLNDIIGTIYRDGKGTEKSLAMMNDSSYTWKMIADFIENNIEAVFKESK